nr:MAG TPA: hypothetical protein [Caudoviricetes sp.]
MNRSSRVSPKFSKCRKVLRCKEFRVFLIEACLVLCPSMN